MEDSSTKYEEIMEKELENCRYTFAGKKTVKCATGLTSADHFDFTNVKREDIVYGVHGDNYITVKAKNIKSEEIGICYLKYITKKAKIINTYPINKEDSFKAFVTEYCNNLRELLIKKNKSYGNSALEPLRIFSKADSAEQIKVRLDDKLSRIANGNDSFNEDTIQDLQGYLVLLKYKKSQDDSESR